MKIDTVELKFLDQTIIAIYAQGIDMELRSINLRFMNTTYAQIPELLLEIANPENGTNLLFQMTLDAFVKSERGLDQLDKPGDCADGFRARKTRGIGKEIVLKVSRTRSKRGFALCGVVSKHKKECFELTKHSFIKFSINYASLL